jgi:hypothetical protein
MPEEARRLMQQQALELRARAEQFRTFAELNRNGTLRQTLLELAQTSDEFAAKIEAALTEIAAP